MRMSNSCPPNTICKTTLKTTRTTPCRALSSFALIAAVAVAGCSSTPLVTPKERVTIKALLTPTIAGTLSDNGAAMAQTTLYLALVESRRDRCFEKTTSTVTDAAGQFNLPGIEPSGSGSLVQRFEVEWQVCAEIDGEVIPLWYDYHAGVLTGDAVTTLACDLSQPEATRCQGEAYSAVSRANPS